MTMASFLYVSFIFFYCAVFLSSVVGNVIVLCRCYWTTKRQPSPIRWFIANLAFSDLTFTVLTLLDYIAYCWTWLGGNVTCKLQGFLIEACYTTSIMTLVVISYERRKAVIKPFTARMRPFHGEKRKLIAIWMASFVTGSPLLYAYNVEIHASGLLFCTNSSIGDLGKQVYYSIHGVCVFIVPLAYMIYSQSTIFVTLRSRAALLTRNNFTTAPTNFHRKVAKTLSAFSVAFAVCWAPFIVFRTLVYFHVGEGRGYAWVGCQLLVILNTVVDPLLYGIYGENMKASLQRFFKCSRFQICATTVAVNNRHWVISPVFFIYLE